MDPHGTSGDERRARAPPGSRTNRKGECSVAQVVPHPPPNTRPGALAAPGPLPEYVYGDSTPFQPGFDFVASLRALVTCGVALMKAQHAIECARARVADAEEHLVLTRADLFAMADAVDEALASHASRQTEVRDVAQRVQTLARGSVTAQLRHQQAALDATLVRADATIIEARRTAAAALGQLLAGSTLPGQSTGFRVVAEDQGYAAEVMLSLPCGLRATFDAELPGGHPLREAPPLRRVRDLRAGTTVRLTRPTGWLRRRLARTEVSLDGLAVLGASLDGVRGALLLGKSPRSGVVHAFDVELGARPARALWRDPEERDHQDLSADDAATLAALLRGFERTLGVPRLRRTAMTEALLDGRALAEQDPRVACARLVHLVAPLACEIAARSGAPGELVLRRNLGAGHRDEVFVTTAELREPIDTLPPSMRAVFAPLALEGLPRSRRAPPRSLATYEELSASELLPAGDEEPRAYLGLPS